MPAPPPAMLSRDIDRDGFREMEVVGLRVEVPSNAPIVLLKEAHGDRYLPIWIGAVEATAIAFAQQGMISLRPLTHDLFRDVLEAVDIRLLSGRITSLVNGIFDGDLVLSNGSIVRSRPSDTITLAMRTGAPVLVSDEILAQAGCDISDITQAPQAGDPDRDKMKPGRTDEARSAPGRDPTGLTMHEPRTAVMIELELVGVRVEMPSNTPILLLKEMQGNRYLPIPIGRVEATAIAFAQQGEVPAAPLTHDLFRDVLDAVNIRLLSIGIIKLFETIFYADLVLSNGSNVSSRTSDAVALAIRTGAKIEVAAEILDDVGVEPDED